MLEVIYTLQSKKKKNERKNKHSFLLFYLKINIFQLKLQDSCSQWFEWKGVEQQKCSSVSYKLKQGLALADEAYLQK